MSKESLGIFELECDYECQKEKILSFFNSRDQTKREKVFSSQKYQYISTFLVTYDITYVCTQESISGLEVIRSQSLYQENKFEILNIQGTNSFFDIYKKLIDEEKYKKIITYPIKYEENIRNSFMKSYVKEGIEFINQDIISKQRSVLTYMIKKIGANILRGKGIMNVSLPIYIFDSRSMLEAFAYGYKLCPLFMDNEPPQGNLDRLKTSFAFLVSELHIGIGVGKPFNPIIGETFQTKIGKADIYLEQTSHHPPIYNIYVKHPEFTAFGFSQMEASASPNTMTAVNLGKFYLKYNDGVLHKFHVPKFFLSGLMLGKRYVNFEGSILVEDLTNNLIAVANINEDDRGVFGKMFTSKKTFPDYFSGFIANAADVTYDSTKNFYKVNSDDCILAKIEGEWSRYIKIDGKEYWRQGEIELLEMEKMDYTLPSDSIFREDILLLKNGYFDLAQEAKSYLEVRQRDDKKSRELFAKKN